MKKKDSYIYIFILIALASTIIGLSLGSMKYSFGQVLKGLFVHDETMEHLIIFKIRLPRVIGGGLVGMALALSGALLQGVMRNNLASPSVIGVTNGASFVGHLTLMAFPAYAYLLPVGTIVGALLTTIFIYRLAYTDGINPNRLVLSGVAVGAMFTAFNNMLRSMFPERLASTLGFTIGSLNGLGWGEVFFATPYIIISIIIALMMSNNMNVLMLGDELSSSLGLKTERFRFLIIIVSSLLSGAAIAIAGLISFVGLIVPHIARIFVGNDYRKLSLASMLLGYSFVILSDAVGRIILPIGEIAVSIIVAFLGAPFFLYLLRDRYRKGH